MTMPGGDNRQAKVTVTADVDPYVKSITAANAATLKFADALQKVDQQVLKIAKIAGAGAMAAGGAGLLKAFGDVKTAAALEQSFKSLSAQATVTGANVGKVTTEIVKLGTQIPIATTSLAAMATQIAALGVQGTNNLKNITKQAEMLAAATNTAPGELMTGLLKLNQSLGGSLENLSRYGSALTALQGKMGVASGDVLNFVQGIEAVGAKAGVTEQQMIGMSAAFVKVGADGFAGAQAFNQVVNDMTDAVARNSPRIQQYANLLGMTSDQFKSLINSGNASQAFVDFINAVTNSGTRASQVLEQFGLDSVRTQRVFAALTGGQANLAQAISDTNAAFSQNNAMAQASAAAWDGFDSQLQRIANAGTQVKNELGAPLLGPLTLLSRAIADVSATFGNFIRFLDDAPWPIGDTLTSLVTKTPALILMGGAFLTLTAAVTRFAGAWRMMTGAVGINAFRGFTDGMRGNAPRELGSTGRLGSLLYRSTYAMGGGTPSLERGIIGVNGRQGIGSMIAGYPLMRFRQQMGGALDTMFHPFSPERRNSGREILGGHLGRMETDPFSIQGMFQQGAAGAKKYRAKWMESLSRQAQETDENGELTSAARRAQAMHGVLGRMEMAPMEESKEFLQRRRFNYVNEARTAAVDEQRKQIARMSHPQLASAMAQAELGEYVARNGTDEGFVGTDFHRMGHRQLIKIANNRKNGLAAYAGATAARDAGTAFDASLTDDETSKLANPFSKLADKVKSITKELATSTGTAMEAVINAITTAYQKAVDMVVALAQKAKQSIMEVQAYAENPSAVFNVATDGTMTRAAAEASQPAQEAVKDIADQIKEALGEKESGSSGGGGHAGGSTIIAGALAPASSFANRAFGLTPEEAARRDATILQEAEGGVRSRRFSFQRVQNMFGAATGEGLTRVGRLAQGAGRLGVSAVSGLAQVGRAVGGLATSLLSPQIMIAATLFGPALYRMVEALISSHQKLTQQTDMAGAAIQQALGRQVVTQQDIVAQQQQRRNQGDNTPYGAVERQNSKAGSFADGYKDQISVLQALGVNGKNPKLGNGVAWLQDYVNGMIAQQNGGKPLDNQQLQQIREILLAATGQNPSVAATIMGQIDTAGARGSGFLAQIGGLYAKSGGDDLRNQLSKTIIGNYDSNTMGGIAGLLVAAGQDRSANTYASDRAFRNTDRSGNTSRLFGGVGDAKTGDLIAQFLNDYNAAHPKSKVDLTQGNDRVTNAGKPDSVADFITQVQRAAKAGNTGAKDIWSQLQGILQPGDISKSGVLSQAALSRLTGLVNGGLGQSSASATMGTQLDGSVLNNAYRRATGDKNGYITSLLGNPEAADYGRKIDAVMGQLNKGTTIFSPDAVKNLTATAEAIQSIKDVIGNPQDPAWQQLDNLQKMTFQNLQAAAALGGGQAFQLNAQTGLLNTMLGTGVTDQNHDDIKAQADQLQQEAQQAVQTLNQYWVQVRDAHIQQERGAQDHHTQMVRMERDYNLQMKEAEYQRTKQLQESNYQFSEQIRQQKYALADAYGNPAQFVQSQYTMGAGAAAIGMQRQLDMLKRSKSAMDQLQKDGLSTDAIRLLGLDDPKNVQQAEKYLTDFANNPELIKTFNSQVSQRLNIANAIAQDPNNSQYNEMKRQFEHQASLATDAFNHSQDQAKAAFGRTMSDFETDYQTTLARSEQDLSRLAEDTTKSWQDLVTWAKNSGIPGIESLGSAAQTAIGAVASAVSQLQQSLALVTSGFATTLSQLGSDWQQFVAKNPQFASANGIDTSSGGGMSQNNNGTGNNKAIVQRIASMYGWGSGSEWNDLVSLVNSESGFNNVAQNPTSSAYGMFQFLNSTWAPYGSKTSDPVKQAEYGLQYVKSRYGDPSSAWRFHRAHNWYAAGAVFDKAQVIGVGEAGPEAVLPLNTTGATFVAKTLRASLQMMGVNPNLANEVRRGQMQQFSSPARSEMHIHHTDASTNFNGAITVVAQDPNEMARKLAERKRMQALTRPVARR